jgi:hypothetical protein
MRALTAAARERMRALLSEGTLGLPMQPFVEAVVELVAHPLGGVPRTGDESHELDVAHRVVSLLEDSLGDEAVVAAAANRLAADDEMLSAFFQNLDLLPGGDSAADAAALLVVSAIGRLGE